MNFDAVECFAYKAWDARWFLPSSLFSSDWRALYMKASEALPELEATTELAARPPLPEIVRRYLEGESIQVLAKECGKTRRTLYNWMLAGLGDENYREAVTQALVGRIAEADERMDLAKTTLAYSKAREMMRFSRMDFERRRPELYGAKALEVRVDIPADAALSGRAGELLRMVAARVVEGEVVEEEK